MSLNPQASIEGLLYAVTESFHKNIKQAVLDRLRDQIGGELEAIAEAEASRITDVVAGYYKDPLAYAEVLQLRLTINGTEVKHDRT